MIVHHLNNSHSHVVLWLLEELGVPYEIVPHKRDPQTRRSPDSLRAIHAAAKAPMIEDHGQVMIESTGIILYILESYGDGRLRPQPGTKDAMTFYQWLTFIEGSAKAPLMSSFQTLRFPPDDERRVLAEQYAERFLGLLDAGLEDTDTIVPSIFTAADIQLTFFEELAEALLPMERWPNMQRHLQNMRQRESYRRAEARGGKVGIKELFQSAR
jgi:glutathione S-transferase